MSAASATPTPTAANAAGATPPGVAAPGKATSRNAKRVAKSGGKSKTLCPVCGVNPLGEDETICPSCADKQMSSREGAHILRNWVLLIVAFGLLLAAGKWLPAFL